MKFMLNTIIVSEVGKGDRCDKAVASLMARTDEIDLCLSVLALGELRKGVEMARRKDPIKADVFESRLNGIVSGFRGRILPINDEVTDEWGRLSALRPLSEADALQAATAKVYELAFVTRNVSDVSRLGVDVLNPFVP